MEKFFDRRLDRSIHIPTTSGRQRMIIHDEFFLTGSPTITLSKEILFCPPSSGMGFSKTDEKM
ncbi:hypothetical protein MUK42_02861 [Musa troglodytarum]|uniref:Uncharacterized protein n=1 Tax=Musa troglodytarum TaxID=320322 RepID=A0A9E7JFK7_9LILI|nr:hypothetical protein MUK42_02861 [Musa troglodytarum]